MFHRSDIKPGTATLNKTRHSRGRKVDAPFVRCSAPGSRQSPISVWQDIILLMQPHLLLTGHLCIFVRLASMIFFWSRTKWHDRQSNLTAVRLQKRCGLPANAPKKTFVVACSTLEVVAKLGKHSRRPFPKASVLRSFALKIAQRFRACCPKKGTQTCSLCGQRRSTPLNPTHRTECPVAAQGTTLCSIWATRPLTLGLAIHTAQSGEKNAKQILSQTERWFLLLGGKD
jgi:hypothetical protein